jgi:hypothetical protein
MSLSRVTLESPPLGELFHNCLVRFSVDAVDTAASLDFLESDGETQLLLQRRGEGAAKRMRMPAYPLDDLVDDRAVLALEQSDIGVARLARSRNVRSREARSRVGRILYA